MTYLLYINLPIFRYVFLFRFPKDEKCIYMSINELFQKSTSRDPCASVNISSTADLVKDGMLKLNIVRSHFIKLCNSSLNMFLIFDYVFLRFLCPCFVVMFRL